jgi:hypothetical protein
LKTENKKEILGQYFTKIEIVEKIIDLLLIYKNFDNSVKILEPSFGTGSFIKVLEQKGFNDIDKYEIDEELTERPFDFFDLPLTKKYDLIIGNPPFTKYNLFESYYKPIKYFKKELKPWQYLPVKEAKSEKIRIENAFIYKCLKHLNKNDSTIAFVLPISFFIKNRNSKLKAELIRQFRTVIVYQNNQSWFDYNIPCCFAIFTNNINYKDKILLIYENSIKHEYNFDLEYVYEEIIPEVVYNKNSGQIINENGISLADYLDTKPICVKKSFTEYNVSAKNILERQSIPEGKNIEDYKLAVVRVGNSSVGKSGLINIKEDTLNDMFFVFDLKGDYSANKKIKEQVCNSINNNLDYFKKVTSRVGSKSIKKEDIFNLKVSF